MLGLGAAAGGACSLSTRRWLGRDWDKREAGWLSDADAGWSISPCLCLCSCLPLCNGGSCASLQQDLSALLCSIKPMSSGLPDDLLVQLGRRCIDTTTTQAPKAFESHPSNAAPSTQQYRQRMAHYPPACQPGHSQPAALPPRPASSQSQPVPSGQNEPTAKNSGREQEHGLLGRSWYHR